MIQDNVADLAWLTHILLDKSVVKKSDDPDSLKAIHLALPTTRTHSQTVRYLPKKSTTAAQKLAIFEFCVPVDFWSASQKLEHTANSAIYTKN